MEQKKLMNDLKAGVFQRAYLLHGEERFLIAHYANAIEKAALDHEDTSQYKDVFDGAIPVHDIIMAAETLPFLSDHRLVFVHDSRLFATGRKDDAEKISKYLPNIPNKTIMVFIEAEVDRRSKLYKQISKIGCVIECESPTPQNLATWVTRIAKERGKNISSAAAHHFTRTVGTNMTSLAQEMNKLAAFCGENTEITATDIDTICTPTMESRIFELTKAITAKRTEDALLRYRDMLILKESPIMILTMIIRQFRIILIAKCAKEKGMTILQTAKEFNLRDFMVDEALRLGQKFTIEQLIDALKNCQDVDKKIKTGVISPEFGVELLIIKYSAV